MLTPLAAKLRYAYPQAEIVMTMPRAWVPLYAGRPYGVKAIGWDPRDPATLDAIFAEPAFDVAYVPGENRYSWLALAAGARWIVAFAGDRPAYKNWPVDERRSYSALPGEWGDITAHLLDGEAPPPYCVKDWPAPPHQSFERPRAAYGVLHVGASTPLKRWEPEKWRALAELLTERGYTVVWSAGRGEEAIVAACDPQRRYASYAGCLDLAQMWHLVAGAALLVSPDTGIAHLGRLTDVPTVTLFGPGSATICGAGDFWRNAPYRAVTIAPFACRDQNILFERRIDWVVHCTRSPRECASPRCMQAIDKARVQAAIDTLLQETGTRSCAASRAI